MFTTAASALIVSHPDAMPRCPGCGTEAAGHAFQTAPEANMDSALRRFARDVFRRATWLFLTAMANAFLLPTRTTSRFARVSAV